jgi:hypothetical protein
MYRRFVWFGSVAALLALFLLAGVGIGRVCAQGRDDSGKNDLPEGEGAEGVKKKWKDKAVQTSWNALRQGKEKPDEKKDKEVIDTAAQWYVYRVTWSEYVGQTSPTAQNSIPNVHRDFDRILNELGKNKDTEKLLGLFSRQAMVHINEVLKNGRLRSRINAGVLMHRLAQAGRQELIPDVVAILKGQQPDYIKLYALKSLRELLERQPPVPTDPQDRKKWEGFYRPAIEELIAWVERSPAIPKDATEEEKKRINEVAQYLRREAIRALAQARVPAVSFDGNGKKVEGPVAYVLLKVLAGDGMSPAPSLSEKVEAAVGLCQVRADPGVPYRSDLALYLVGRFIAKEFARAYNDDQPRFASTDLPDKKPKKGRKEEDTGPSEPRQVRAEPWKIHQARLFNGLKEMENATANATAKNNIRKVTNQLGTILAAAKFEASPKSWKLMDSGAIDTLANLVNSLKPTDTVVFTGVKEFQVKLDSAEP